MRPPAAKPASPATRALQVVPPSGPTAWLTTFTSGAMTFLCVFALALSLASGRLADRWQETLARTATIRLSAPADFATLGACDVIATPTTPTPAFPFFPGSRSRSQAPKPSNAAAAFIASCARPG